MKMLKMKCPSCGGELNIDLDNIQADCPYCRQKLMFDVDMDNYVNQKEETKRSLGWSDKVGDFINFLDKRDERKRQEQLERYKLAIPLLIVCIIIWIIWVIGSSIMLK